jgi:membrane fusion protein (multidrug efflux system)
MTRKNPGHFAWLAAILLAACGGPEGGAKKDMPLPEVNIVEAVQRTLPRYTEYVGQTLGIQDVDIVPRVEGWITGMHFKEGSLVQKGSLLYTIDDLPIRTSMDAAAANLAKARTQLVNKKTELDRVRPLTEMNALSRRDLDAANAAYEAARAEVAMAEAQLGTSKIQLGYTRITSPITGIIGISKVQVGDYVNRSGFSAINTISSLGDVRVRFPISENEYMKFFNQGKQAGGQTGAGAVELELGDGTLYPERGRIDLANRAVDPQTGSLLVQAIFPNKSGLIRPGQYVKVRFLTDLYKDAVLVPQQAVNQLQSIYQVFVLGDSSKLTPRVVKTGARIGSNWIITEGLKAGDKVAIIGSAAINPARPVKPKPMPWNYDSTTARD